MFRSLCLSAILLVASCTPKQEQIPPLPIMQESSNKIVVYQLMTRLFGNKKTENKTYGTLEENGVGKFEDINDAALQSLKELGITHVWYTGVIEHATLSDNTRYGIPLDDADVVKGRAGSPYSIKDYYDINPDLAVNVPNRIKEFEQLVERTHRHDLKVIIDFIPNHVARAYKSDMKPKGVKDLGEFDDKSVSFKPSNNFYYLPGKSFVVPAGYDPLGPDNTFPTKDGKFEETPAKATANDQFRPDPVMNDWFEAIKLNYGIDIEDGRKKYFDPIPETWSMMRDILLYWTQKGVDGFRCDIAEMVPVEFWNWVIPQVKAANPEIIFIAEIYNPAEYRNFVHTGRFDFLYDKVQLYDTLRLLINGKSSTADIPRIQQSLEGINDNMLHFLENHDEQRIASRFFAGDPWKAVPAMVISATIDRAPVLIYFGQEVGEPALGDPGYQNLESEGVTTKMDYWGVPEHQKWMNDGKFDGGLLSEDQQRLRKFYADVLNIAGKNPAIAKGDYYDLTLFNIAQKNITDEIFACLRVHENERLLIVAGFNKSSQRISITIPDEVALSASLSQDQEFILVDQLWGEEKLTLGNLKVSVDMPAFGAYIFKINP